MIPRICWRTASAVLGGVALIGPATISHAQMACDPCGIGIVFDGPSDFNPDFRASLEDEINGLAQPRFTVVFPEPDQRTADWTLDGARAKVEQALADPGIAIVVTGGPISSSYAINRGNLEKPVVATFVLDPEAQRFPLQTNAAGERVSGVANLSYITFTRDAGDEIRSLREVVPFRQLAYLVSSQLLDAVPALEASLTSLARQAGIDAKIVRVGQSVESALGTLPESADAVYVTPLPQLSADGLDRLARGLIGRRLPSFSYWGQSEVERGLLASLYVDTDLPRLSRRAGLHVQRILAGEEAGSLPVDFRRRRRLTLNMRTARQIGVHPNWGVLTEADLLHDELPAGTRRLNLASVAHEAVAANLDLAAFDRSISAGEHSVRVARAALRPQVTASGSFDTIDRDNPQLTLGLRPAWRPAGSIGVSQLLYSDGAKARAAVEQQVQLSREEARQELLLNVAHSAAIAYLGVLRAKTFEGIHRQNLRRTRENLELVQLRMRIGAARPSEVIRWESQIARDRQAVLQAGAALRVVEIALNRLLHRPLEEPFATTDVDLQDPALLTSTETIDTYMGNPFSFAIFRNFMAAEALAHSPELRQIDASISATERTVLAARRSFWAPTVAATSSVVAAQNGQGLGTLEDLGLPFSFNRPNALNWSVALSATLPLSVGGARKAELSRAEEQLHQLRITRLASAERIEQRLRSELHEAGAAYAGIDLAAAAAEAAQRSLALVADAYETGAVPIVALIDAQNAAVVAEQSAATAAYDYLAQLMDVHRAVGRFGFFMATDERAAFGERLAEFFREADHEPRLEQ